MQAPIWKTDGAELTFANVLNSEKRLIAVEEITSQPKYQTDERGLHSRRDRRIGDSIKIENVFTKMSLQLASDPGLEHHTHAINCDRVHPDDH